MLKIGLTGGIASGKSTVADMLKQLGAPIFDADKEAHLLLKKSGVAYTDIKEKFVDKLKADILTADGDIDRKKLGAIVFSDRELLAFLEQTMHGKILGRMNDYICEQERAGKVPAVVLDIPLLVEKGWQENLDKVWLVYVPVRLQKERLRLRENITDEEIEKRLAVQLPIEDKRKHASLILDNSGSREDTQRSVQAAWNDIVNKR